MELQCSVSGEGITVTEVSDADGVHQILCSPLNSTFICKCAHKLYAPCIALPYSSLSVALKKTPFT